MKKKGERKENEAEQNQEVPAQTSTQNKKKCFIK